MKSEITTGVIVAVVAAAIGYTINAFQERPRPGVSIEDVEFQTVPRDNAPLVAVPKDLQEKSAHSNWVHTLEDQISLKDLQAEIKEANEAAKDLAGLSKFMPVLVQFMDEHQASDDYASQYRQFVTRNIDKDTLFAFVVEVSSGLHDGKIVLHQVVNKHPTVAVVNEDNGDDSGDDSNTDSNSRSGDKNRVDNADLQSLFLLQEWFPQDLRAATNMIDMQLADEVETIHELLGGLNSLYDEEKQFSVNEYIAIRVLLVNSGRSTVTFDRFGALGVSTLKTPIFMSSEGGSDRISVEPGKAKELSLRTNVSEADFAKLQNLYHSNDALTCSITTRMVSIAGHRTEWVTSPPAAFFGNTNALQGEFMKHAVIPPPLSFGQAPNAISD